MVFIQPCERVRQGSARTGGWGQRLAPGDDPPLAHGRWDAGARWCLDCHAILLHETLISVRGLRCPIWRWPGSTEVSGLSQAYSSPWCVSTTAIPIERCGLMFGLIQASAAWALYPSGERVVTVTAMRGNQSSKKHLQYQQWLSRCWRDGHGVLTQALRLLCGNTSLSVLWPPPPGGKTSLRLGGCCQRYFLATGLYARHLITDACNYLSGNLPVPAGLNITVIAIGFNRRVLADRWVRERCRLAIAGPGRLRYHGGL